MYFHSLIFFLITGASASNIAVAAWIKRLAREKWVPAVPPGAAPGDPPTCVLRPCEVVLSSSLEGSLSRDQSGSRIVIKGSSHGHSGASGEDNSEVMPVARLSPRALRTLQQLPALVSEVFAWGTVKPPPPVDQLEAFVKARHDFPDHEESAFQGGMASCSHAQYVELVGIWRGLCIAQKENRLSNSDRQRIRAACGVSSSSSSSSNNSSCGNSSRRPTDTTTPSLIYLIPGHIKDSLYALSRCVSLNGRSLDADMGAQSDKEIGASLLCRVGFLFDLGSESLQVDSDHAGGGREDKPVSWPLGSVRHELVDLLSPSSEVQVPHALDFIKQSACAVSDDYRHRAPAPSPAQKKALSLAMWTIITNTIGDCGGAATVDDRLIARARKDLQRSLPDLYVYCSRGPSGPTAYESRWLPVWPKEGTSASSLVRPVLLDDLYSPPRGCGISRSSLLTRDHKLQPLGIFDHCNNRHLSGSVGPGSRDFFSKLSRIDSVILKVIDISCISDRKHFSLVSKTNGKAEEITGSTDRLQVVLLLLRVLLHHSAREAPAIPPVFKHESLSIIFKSPEYRNGKTEGLSLVNTYPVYAIRGGAVPVAGAALSGERSSKPPTVQSILLAGSPQDYAAELEEIVYGMAVATSRQTMSTSQNSSAQVRKALSLLRYLEEEEDFFKFFGRYFGEYEMAPSGAADVGDEGAPDGAEGDSAEGEGETRPSCHEQLSSAMLTLKKIKREKEAAEAAAQAERAVRKRKNRLAEVEANIYGPSGHPLLDDSAVEMVDMDSHRSTKRSRPSEQTDDYDVCDKPGSEEVQRSNDVAAKSFLNSVVLPLSDASTAPPSRVPVGRGRGVCNLPSWLAGTEEGSSPAAVPLSPGVAGRVSVDKGPDVSYRASLAPAAAPATGSEEIEVAPSSKRPLTGSGRGVTNLPAWMTGDSILSAARDVTTADDSVSGDQFADASGEGAGAGGDVSDSRSCKKQRAGSPAEANGAGSPTGILMGKPLTGRGRGVSNTPAWLENPDLLGRVSDPLLLSSSVDAAVRELTEDSSVVAGILHIVSVASSLGLESASLKAKVKAICEEIGVALSDLPPSAVNRVERCVRGSLRAPLRDLLSVLCKEGLMQRESYRSLDVLLADD
jgi:hypothetical protein